MSRNWSGAPGVVGASFMIMPTMVFMLLSTTAATSSASLPSRSGAQIVNAVLIPANVWARSCRRTSVQSVREPKKAVSAPASLPLAPRGDLPHRRCLEPPLLDHGGGSLKQFGDALAADVTLRLQGR